MNQYIKKIYLKELNIFIQIKKFIISFQKKYSMDYIKNKLDSKFIRFGIFKVDRKCKLVHNTE